MRLFTISAIIIFIYSVPVVSATVGNDVFNQLVTESAKIKSVDCELTQYITERGSMSQYNGRYRVNESGFFRIDYSRPVRQLVIKNDKGLFWYFPDDRNLFVIGERDRSHAPGVNPLDDIIKHSGDRFSVKYLGTHFYGFFNKAHHFMIQDKHKGLVFAIISDSEKKVVLEKIIKNSDGFELIKERYTRHKKINGIYFPHRVDVFARTDTGVTRNTTYYENIMLNADIPDHLFILKIPRGTVTKYIDGK